MKCQSQEFIIILPEADRDEAQRIAERIRIKVEEYNFQNKEDHLNPEFDTCKPFFPD